MSFINSSNNNNNNSVQLLQNSEKEEDKEQELEEQEEVFFRNRVQMQGSKCVEWQQQKMLYLMCIRLSLPDSANEELLFSSDHEPWSQLPKTPVFWPRNNELVKEFSRRVSLLKIAPVPRPKNWTRSQAMDWLSRNPISSPTDAEFLQMEVAMIHSVLVLSQQQEKEQQQESVIAARSCSLPLIDFDSYFRCCQGSLSTRGNARTRQELNGRNSEIRPQTVFELISSLWNSDEYNPIAAASECHPDFIDATDCSYEQVQLFVPATPQKVEDILSSMRSDLVRIISRWEQSGQGEDGRDNEEEECDSITVSTPLPTNANIGPIVESIPTCVGELSGRPARALQNRSAFLNGRPSYLLYFWEIVDTHQLLQSTLQKLNHATGASDASQAPSTSSTLSNDGSSQSFTSSNNRGRRRIGASSHRSPAADFVAPSAESIRDLTDCQLNSDARIESLDNVSSFWTESSSSNRRKERTKSVVGKLR